MGWLVLHWVIIVNFLLNIGYGGYQVFVALAPDGAVGPLWGKAREMPFEQMVARRMYASEVWISIAGLCIYLAITEFLPRLLAKRSDAAADSSEASPSSELAD